MKRNQNLKVNVSPPPYIGEAVGSQSNMFPQPSRSNSKHSKPGRHASTRSGRVSPLSAPASPVNSEPESLNWALREPEPFRPLAKKPGKKQSEFHLRDSQVLNFTQADGFAMRFQQAGPAALEPIPPRKAKTHQPRQELAAQQQEQWVDIPLDHRRPAESKKSRNKAPRPVFSASRHNDAFQKLTRAEAGKAGPTHDQKVQAHYAKFSAPSARKSTKRAWITALVIAIIVALGIFFICLMVGKK